MITKNTAEFYDNYIISHGLYIFVRSLVETKHISIISDFFLNIASVDFMLGYKATVGWKTCI